VPSGPKLWPQHWVAEVTQPMMVRYEGVLLRIQKSLVGRMWSSHEPSREGCGCGEGVSPSPPHGEGAGEGALPPPQNFFSILDLKMASFCALWVLKSHASVGMHPPILHLDLPLKVCQ